MYPTADCTTFLRMSPISILLPVFNASASLPEAIKSIQEQSFRDWEMIAIDDGSTDDSLEILEAYAARDPRIRVLSIPHGGIVRALNSGLHEAAGEYIARMDADDWAYPSRLHKQWEWLNQHPRTGLVGSLIEHGGDAGTQAGYAHHIDWLNSLLSAEEIALNRFVDAPLAHPSVMFRRTCLAARKHTGKQKDLRIMSSGSDGWKRES